MLPVWIFAPQSRVIAICQPDGSYTERNAGELELPGTQIVVDLLDIFAALDEYREMQPVDALTWQTGAY